jgi:hypothetical protein
MSDLHALQEAKLAATTSKTEKLIPEKALSLAATTSSAILDSS